MNRFQLEALRQILVCLIKVQKYQVEGYLTHAQRNGLDSFSLHLASKAREIVEFLDTENEGKNKPPNEPEDLPF